MNQPKPPNRRRLSRLAAVQALYQVERQPGDPASVVQEFLAHRLGESIDGVSIRNLDRDFFKSLVEGVGAQREELDDMLTGVLPEDWSVERLEEVLLIILRAGLYELLERHDVPPKVIINEYVDLADAYFDQTGTGLANGILDQLGHHLRPDEFDDRGQTVP